MTASVLVDANVLVYAHDSAEPEKQQLALRVLDGVVDLGVGAVSTQVLGEFFTVVTRKIPSPLDGRTAGSQLRLFAATWPVLPIDEAVVNEALELHLCHGLNYWDAQVLATARLNGCRAVLTEDTASPHLAGVRFANPFAEGFDLESAIGS